MKISFKVQKVKVVMGKLKQTLHDYQEYES